MDVNAQVHMQNVTILHVKTIGVKQLGDLRLFYIYRLPAWTVPKRD